MSRIHKLFSLAVTLYAIGGATSAMAQLEVNIELDKKTYVAHEKVVATLTVQNRAGRDVILDGPGRSWVDFFIRDADNEMIGSIRPIDIDKRILKAGESHTLEVVISDYFRLYNYGRFRVAGAAYFAPAKRFYQSAEESIMVTEARTFWSRSVGVPAGYPGAGGARKYELMTFQDYDSSSLYLRLRDDASNQVIHTYSLGRLIPFRDPQVSLDKGNHLHALFLTGPDIYRHAVIKPNGSVADVADYRAGGSTPRLMVSKEGTVRIRGGAPLSDSQRSLTAADVPTGNGHSFVNPLGGGPASGTSNPGGNSGSASANEGRSLSDRPPGLQ